MSKSMLAAVHEAANRTPPEMDAAEDLKTNPIAAALAAALAFIVGEKQRPEAAAPAAPATPAIPAAPAAEPAKPTAADAATIIDLCNAGGVPAMASALVKEGLSLDEAKVRIEGAKEIKTAVALAAKSSKAIDLKLADEYIAAGASIDHVRAQLFDKLATAQSPEITGEHQGGTGKPEAQATAEFWSQAAASVNAALGLKNPRMSASA